MGSVQTQKCLLSFKTIGMVRIFDSVVWHYLMRQLSYIAEEEFPSVLLESSVGVRIQLRAKEITQRMEHMLSRSKS